MHARRLIVSLSLLALSALSLCAQESKYLDTHLSPAERAVNQGVESLKKIFH